MIVTASSHIIAHVCFKRLVNLAACVRAQNDTSLVSATELAIEYYLKTDPRSDNWWWNQYRVPSRIADAALLFRPWIKSQHTRDIMVTVLVAHDVHPPLIQFVTVNRSLIH